ncbi:MAG: sigma-70 family RNA polymerase sigma factor [Acidimicrobiia bacterium]|nr:sigma-70 family RNA polymerase sigma factor [Acidimicrobiia bacterium]
MDGPADAYRRLAPAVFGYLRARAAAEPEDLLGEVFLQVARDWRRFKGDDEDLRRWVFTIARNRAIDEGRRRQRRPQLGGSLPEVAAPPADPPFEPALRRALEELTDEQREVVLLRFVGDLSIEQVADLCDRSPGAVKSLQHRALARLEASVSPELLG